MYDGGIGAGGAAGPGGAAGGGGADWGGYPGWGRGGVGGGGGRGRGGHRGGRGHEFEQFAGLGQPVGEVDHLHVDAPCPRGGVVVSSGTSASRE